MQLPDILAALTRSKLSATRAWHCRSAVTFVLTRSWHDRLALTLILLAIVNMLAIVNSLAWHLQHINLLRLKHRINIKHKLTRYAGWGYEGIRKSRN